MKKFSLLFLFLILILVATASAQVVNNIGTNNPSAGEFDSDQEDSSDVVLSSLISTCKSESRCRQIDESWLIFSRNVGSEHSSEVWYPGPGWITFEEAYPEEIEESTEEIIEESEEEIIHETIEESVERLPPPRSTRGSEWDSYQISVGARGYQQYGPAGGEIFTGFESKTVSVAKPNFNGQQDSGSWTLTIDPSKTCPSGICINDITPKSRKADKLGVLVHATDTTGQYTTIGRRWSEDFWIDYYDCHTESVDEWNEAYSLQCGSILTENGYSQYGDKWPYSDLETENQYLNDATQNALAACAKGINSNADNGGYRKSMDTCRNMGGKTHYILGREGNYLQHAAEEAALGHSRTSRNDDRIPTQHRDPFTIAIEVDSALSHCRSNCAIPLSLWGSQENYLPQSDLTGRKDQERKLRQNADALEIYSDPQMKGLIKLVTEIMIRHNIHIDDLIRHYDNSKRGSSTHWDPGQNFDWMGFKKSVCQAINDYNGQSVYDCENLIVCRECGEV